MTFCKNYSETLDCGNDIIDIRAIEAAAFAVPQSPTQRDTCTPVVLEALFGTENHCIERDQYIIRRARDFFMRLAVVMARAVIYTRPAEFFQIFTFFLEEEQGGQATSFLSTEQFVSLQVSRATLLSSERSAVPVGEC